MDVHASCSGRSVPRADEIDHGPSDRLAGTLLGDPALDQYATRQGDVDGLLERALGPVATAAGNEIWLAFRRIGVTP